MHCQNCGKEIDEKAEICMGCGVRVSPPIKEDVGIAKKLGKMGIPGFRSGKTWKMILASIVYFFIIMAIIAPSGDRTTTSDATAAGTVHKADVNAKNVMITYSGKTLDTTDEFTKPKPGNTYLVVDVKVENNGYSELPVNPLYFSVIANSVKYSASLFNPSEMTDKMSPVTIMDGGTVSGSVAFEVPKNTGDFKLEFEPMNFKTYNVQYVTK